MLGPRVLVISDDGVVKAGLVQPALASLTEAGAETSIFTGVVADPPEAIIHTAAAQAVTFGATGVLGIGGGSSLDVAKLVALIAKSGEALGTIYGVGKVTGSVCRWRSCRQRPVPDRKSRRFRSSPRVNTRKRA